MRARIDNAYWPLRIVYGVIPLVAGLDKFFNLLTFWPKYISPTAAALLPMSPQAFMHVAGVIEMAVGLAVLSRFTRHAAYVAAVWLLAITGNLILAGLFDIAARDVSMAVGAYALARLAEARALPAEEVESRPLTRHGKAERRGPAASPPPLS